MNEVLSRLAPALEDRYRIEREIGSGGMATVYVARDIKHDREVALKVLRPELAAVLGADRFLNEIRITARLDHPHILTLIDSGVAEGFLYYVLPFVRGESLRDRLRREKQLGVDEAINITKQIGSALEYAHRQGVIHRDVKPENILIHEGEAVLTDFGIALAVKEAGGNRLTESGLSLGTPQYMSPEQATGDRTLDARSDEYSLAAVLYEMLVGEAPHTGPSIQAIIAKLLTQRPVRIRTLRETVPESVDIAVDKALTKLPADRFATVGEFARAVSAVEGSKMRSPFVWNSQRIAVAAGITGLIVTALIVSTIAFRRSGETLTIVATRQLTSSPGLEVQPAVSPDGKMVAYVGPAGHRQQIFVKQISGGRAVLLTDTLVGGIFPTWDPSSSAVYFTTSDGIYSVPALGGPASKTFSDPNLYDCAWASGGDKLACTSAKDGGLYLIDSRGGSSIRLVDSQGPEPLFAAQWSPGDKLIAYVRGNLGFVSGSGLGNINGTGLGNIAPSAIWIVSAKGGEPVRITDETHLHMSPVWMSDGSLLFVSSNGGARDIYRQQLDGDGHPRGDAVRLTTGLNVHTISLSRDGHWLVYTVLTTIANVWSTPIPAGPSSLAPVFHPITTGHQTIETLSVSPDRKWLAYDSNLNGNQDIYKVSLAGGEPHQLTHNGADNFSPAWSADGGEIAFHSLAKGNRDILVMPSDGSGVHAAVATARQERSPSWSVDGLRLVYQVEPDSVFTVTRPAVGSQHWSLPKFLCSPCRNPKWSPDGQWILFTDGVGDLWKLEPAGGRQVEITRLAEAKIAADIYSWSRDSRTVYLVSRDPQKIWGVWKVSSAGGKPVRLLSFTDSDKGLYTQEFTSDGANFYFSLGSRESDLWIMDLARK